MTATLPQVMIPVAGETAVRPVKAGDAIRLYGSTSGFVGFKPASAAGSTVWELPVVDGTVGQFLKTDGAGTLSFATVSTDITIDTTAITGGGANRILFESGTNKVSESANLTWDGSKFTISQPVSTSDSPTGLLFTGGAHTTLAASTEASDVNFNLYRTVQFETGALASQRAIKITAPTYAFVGASTLTRASTVGVVGAPVAGTNATITNRHMLSLIATSDTDVTSGLYIRAGTTAQTVASPLEVVAGDGSPSFKVGYGTIIFGANKTTINAGTGEISLGSNTGSLAGIMILSGGYGILRTVGTIAGDTYTNLQSYNHIVLSPGLLGGVGNVGINNTAPGAKLHVAAGSATTIGAIIQGAAAQTANLTEWQDSAGTIGSTVSENQYFTTRKVAAPADGELAASELAYWFDDTNGAGKLMVKAKTANGTVVTGSIALA